jgi:TolA-binding protein
MSANGFYLYMLVLLMGLMEGYSFFKNHFSGINELKQQVAILEKRVEEEKTKTYIAYHESENTRQELAALMPDKIHDKNSYQVRNLASVLQVQEPLDIDLSQGLMQKGRDLFNAKRINEARIVFKQLVTKYPESNVIIEAYFLLSECEFESQMTEDYIDTVETMITLYPESELTGYAMLRLSTVYLSRKLDDDAVLILQTVKNAFSRDSQLVEQANALLKKAQP